MKRSRIASATVIFVIATIAVGVRHLTRTTVVLRQLDYDRIEAKVMRSAAPVAGARLKIEFEGVELAVTTDRGGRAIFRVPTASAGPRIRASTLLGPSTSLVLQIPQKKDAPQCRAAPLSYFHLELRCNRVQSIQKWPPEARRFDVTSKEPLTGTVVLDTGEVETPAEVTNGITSVRLGSLAAHELIRHQKLIVKHGKGSSTVSVKLPRLDDKVAIVGSLFQGTWAKIEIENRTLNEVRVRVRAGYKEDGRWARCIAADCVGDKSLTMEPGEKGSVTVRYRRPYDFVLHSGDFDEAAEAAEVVRRPW